VKPRTCESLEPITRRAKEEISEERRAFLITSVLALAGVAVTLGGCGYDPAPTSDKGTSNDTEAASSEAGVISANHGHSAVLSGAVLEAGDAVLLDITGSSGHLHTVSLSAALVQAIASGTRVTVASGSESGHSHTVTFN
jgi:hypothetical protein